MLNIAFELAKESHKGQVDKNGVDYMQHLIFVQNHVSSEEGKIVAMLHDIIEDTDIVEQDLKDKGFSDTIINAVKCLTKDSSDRLSYLARVKKNEIAREVKIADLMHNSMVARYKSPTIKNVDKCIHYLEELKYLLDSTQ